MRIYEDDFGKRLQEALGLEGRTIAEVHLHVVRGELITLDIVECLQNAQGGKLIELMKHYHLEENVEKVVPKIKIGDEIYTIHPVAGEIRMFYDPTNFDVDGFTQTRDFGKIHISDFKKK